MKFAELDNVLFRARDGRLYREKLIGGRWVPHADSARVVANGIPMNHTEARSFAGKEWPEDRPH